MVLDKTFEENFDNRLLVKINNTYDIESTSEIKIEIEKFSLYKRDIEYLQRFQIIDENTYILNINRYNYFRSYINKKSIEGIEGSEIIKLINELNNEGIDHKSMLEIIKRKGFTKNDHCIFYNYRKLCIRSCLMHYGKELYNILSKKGIYLNKENGDVFLDGNKLGSINISTQDFTFFKFLYDNSGKNKTHKEIKEYIIGNQKINNTDGNFLSVIKGRLDKPIRNLISSTKGGYILKIP